jgi:hypothetical protein
MTTIDCPVCGALLYTDDENLYAHNQDDADYCDAGPGWHTLEQLNNTLTGYDDQYWGNEAGDEIPF